MPRDGQRNSEPNKAQVADEAVPPTHVVGPTGVEDRERAGLIEGCLALSCRCTACTHAKARRTEETFTQQAAKVFAALRGVNLEPLDERLSPCIVSVGILTRRRMRLPVVWLIHMLPSFEETCLGLRRRLGGDGLLVLLGHPQSGSVSRLLADRIVTLDLLDSPIESLAVWRVLDVLDPSYRMNRLTDPSAIFDEVRLEFATTSDKHVLRINGREFSGFQRSDLKFLRLLFLAAARACDGNVEGGGWVDKFKLQGDERDHDLEALRDELRKHSHPDLTADERAGLLRTSQTRDGRIRLAVHPLNIRFDQSLSWLSLLGELNTKNKNGKRKATPGTANLEQNLARGRKVAKKLLAEARKLGVPSPT